MSEHATLSGKYAEYCEYRDSGVEWLGEVPSHWGVLPCRACVNHLVAKNTDGKEDNYLSLMANIGIVLYEDKGDVGNKKPDDLTKCKLVRKGNLVINSMNYAIGSYGMSPYDGICSPVYIILDANKYVVEERYALRLFENKSFQKHLAILGNGILVHRAAISWDDIKGQYIPIPSIEEQRTIAAFLDYETARIDQLIAKQQRLIELLKEKRQAVISHAVTKGLNPNAPMKDSGVEWLGQVPEHWSISQPRYLCHFVGGGTPSKENPFFWDGDIPWVSPKDMKLDFISDSIDKISEHAISESSVKLIPSDAVLMVVRGMILAHSVPVALTTVPVTINQDMKAMIVDSRKLNGEYWLRLLQGIKNILLDLTESSAHGTKCLRSEDFDKLSIPIPPLEEQTQIIEYTNFTLARIDKLLLKATNLIGFAKERRTALISAAVTGKIDLRDWTPPKEG